MKLYQAVYCLPRRQLDPLVIQGFGEPSSERARTRLILKRDIVNDVNSGNHHPGRVFLNPLQLDTTRKVSTSRKKVRGSEREVGEEPYQRLQPILVHLTVAVKEHDHR